MSYAVLLHFDLHTESVINEVIDLLATQINPIEPLPPGFRPHITLTGFDPPFPTGLMERLEETARTAAPIPIHLAAVGAFPGDQCVVFLALAANPELMKLHEKISRILAEMGVDSNPNFMAGTWVPHCSVAYNLNLEQACRAVQFCLKSQVYNQGALVSLGVTEFLPIKDLCIYPLGR
ncbi:MAG TPA: 2'-5' RNA ligase family protein [Anaerolineales bacterium]|nr:2'-5' RNA ligase family protein [Anaerolineales bacterium]